MFSLISIDMIDSGIFIYSFSLPAHLLCYEYIELKSVDLLLLLGNGSKILRFKMKSIARLVLPSTALFACSAYTHIYQLVDLKHEILFSFLPCCMLSVRKS